MRKIVENGLKIKNTFLREGRERGGGETGRERERKLNDRKFKLMSDCERESVYFSK